MDEGLVSLPEAIVVGSAGLLAFTGGGGKTSLMMALSSQLSGGVVMTTTTRLSISQAQQVAEVIRYLPSEVGGALDQGLDSKVVFDREELYQKITESLLRSGKCMVIGEPHGDKVNGLPVDLPGRIFSRDDVAYVLVEADGSRRKPCKAPGPHEPVIPPEATLVLPTVGIDAIGKPISEIAHRPKRVKAITGLEVDQLMTVRALARLMTHQNGGLKGIPQKARVVPFLNKVDSDDLLDKARGLARLILEEDQINRVISGAIRSNRPVREIHRRITAIVLAAGLSTRMGRPKLLLPWGDTTVLGRTIGNLQRSGVNEIIVVSGFQAQEVEGISAQLGVQTFFNELYASGGMITSVQTALRLLPDNREAILVMLADQPMVETESIDRLVKAWSENKGELLAPVIKGRRGNPVLIGRRYFDELLSLPVGSAPRDLLSQHSEQLKLVEVETDSILRDLDEIEDYERWRPKSGSS
jgi:molybdenum cofactor cytidylyltransferase